MRSHSDGAGWGGGGSAPPAKLRATTRRHAEPARSAAERCGRRDRDSGAAVAGRGRAASSAPVGDRSSTMGEFQ